MPQINARLPIPSFLFRLRPMLETDGVPEMTLRQFSHREPENRRPCRRSNVAIVLGSPSLSVPLALPVYPKSFSSKSPVPQPNRGRSKVRRPPPLQAMWWRSKTEPEAARETLPGLEDQNPQTSN